MMFWQSDETYVTPGVYSIRLLITTVLSQRVLDAIL